MKTRNEEAPNKVGPYTQADMDEDLVKLRASYPRYTWSGRILDPLGALIWGQSDTRPSFLVEARVQETATIKVEISWRSMQFRPPVRPHRPGGVHHAVQQTFFALDPQVRSIAKALDVALERA